jgi:hypothetical protein
MTVRTIIALLCASALLAGCASHPDLSNFDDDSERAHEAILANIDNVRGDIEDDDRDARLRYARKLTDVRMSLDTLRLRAEGVRFDAENRRQLERAFEIAYRTLETYARFPGRVNEQGEFVSRPARTDLDDAIAAVEGELGEESEG